MLMLGFGWVSRKDAPYTDTNSDSVSFIGHENDIMGSPKGNIKDYHIRTLIKNYGGK